MTVYLNLAFNYHYPFILIITINNIFIRRKQSEGTIFKKMYLVLVLELDLTK